MYYITYTLYKNNIHKQESQSSNSPACLQVVKVDVVKTILRQLSDTQIYRVGCCCLAKWWLVVVVGCEGGEAV